MEWLRVAGATVNQTPLDWDGNEQRLRVLLNTAKDQGVDILCLPELCISGYGLEDMFSSLHCLTLAEELLLAILPATKGLSAVLGLPVYYQGQVYNAAALCQDGKILGVNAKKRLAREGIHYEPRWFSPWLEGQVGTLELAGQSCPIGDLSYQLGNVHVALEICEEAWGVAPSAGQHTKHGAELVLNPSASHFALGKASVRESLVANNSRAMQAHYVYANLLGLEGGRTIYDGGVLIADCGQIVARGQRFGFHDGSLTIAELDIGRARVAKLKNRAITAQGSLAESVSKIRGRCPRELAGSTKVPLASGLGRISFPAAPGQWELSREEEFLAAETLGLWDYLRKSKAKGFVVSLSGGVDSATVAVLVAQMAHLAEAELGSAKMESKSWLKAHLTTIYQRSANSGTITQQAASALATALGAEFMDVSVAGVIAAYQTLAESALGRPLQWDTDDLALQNIQARSRAPMAWMIANVKEALLLSTSNRSEAAVGYTTMDGDTAGGLAPLGGIDKHFLRAWLRWAETEMRWGYGPIAALAAVNIQAPTAELRPTADLQTDEKDLMPYAVLVRLEQFLVRDRLAPAAMLELLQREFPERDAALLRQDLGRFLRLFTQSQWKRERLAPCFHLEDPSLDPKSFWRYPILSGGYDRELREL